MERIEEDATPAEEWLQSLNATCNRLSTQYLNMLKAASSVSALDQGQSLHGPRGTSVCVACVLLYRDYLFVVSAEFCTLLMISC